MGYEVTAYGIEDCSFDDQFFSVPVLADICSELGFSSLVSTLEMVHDTPGQEILRRHENDVAVQYQILDTLDFVDHVKKNPVLWEDHGFGWNHFIGAIQANPQLTWWIVCHH